MKFHRGSYKCECKDGFYFPHRNENNYSLYFNGSEVEKEYLDKILDKDNKYDQFKCIACSKGCESCVDDSPCLVDYDVMLRGIPLGIQSFSMTITIVIGLLLIRLRKCKVRIIFLLSMRLYIALCMRIYCIPSRSLCFIK